MLTRGAGHKEFRDTEIERTPKDWNVSSLGDIALDVYRYPTYFNISYVDKGVPEVRGELVKENGELEEDLGKYRFISEKTSRKFPRTILKEGDFVLSVRGTMGKVALVPRKLIGANITANLIRISLDRSKCYSPFFKQFFLSDVFKRKLDEFSSQTTIKTIQAPRLKSIKAPVPSLVEQQKIVEILQTIDNIIDKTKDLIEKYKKMKQGLMQDLLDKRKSILGADGKPIEKWVLTTLGNLVTRHDAGVYKKADLYGSGRNIVGVSDLYYNESIDGQVFRLVRLSPEEAGSYTLKEGDLIYGESSLVLEGIARTLYVTPRGEGTAFAWHTRRIRVNRKKVDPQFLHYLLNHETVRRQIMSVATQTALTGITTADFFNIKLSLPDLLEQIYIRDRVKSIIDMIQAEQFYLYKLIKMKAGLMQDLLTGKVRVAA